MKTSKKCTSCNKIKMIDNYAKLKTVKSGIRGICKKCESENSLLFRRSKTGIATSIYWNQKSHSKDRKHNPPTYTKLELKGWMLSQDIFHKLYDEWVASGYVKDLIPSVDRKNNNIGYTMDNIQIMTFKENEDKAHLEMRAGIIINGVKPQKKVLQFTQDMVLIQEFVSVQKAARATYSQPSKISAVCLNKRKSTNGFKWRHKIKE